MSVLLSCSFFLSFAVYGLWLQTTLFHCEINRICNAHPVKRTDTLMSACCAALRHYPVSHAHLATPSFPKHAVQERKRRYLSGNGGKSQWVQRGCESQSKRSGSRGARFHLLSVANHQSGIEIGTGTGCLHIGNILQVFEFFF